MEVQSEVSNCTCAQGRDISVSNYCDRKWNGSHRLPEANEANRQIDAASSKFDSVVVSIYSEVSE